jgi:death on curing protein
LTKIVAAVWHDSAVIMYLDASDLLVLAAAVTGGDLVVRDLGLLDAAAHRPRATVLGVQAYETLWLKAAALLDSIVCTRPLVEGNWRLGWVAAVTICDMNGWWIDADEDEALELVREVGRGNVGVPEMAQHLEEWAHPKESDM